MTKSDVRTLLIKSTCREHGIYVFRLFDFVFGDENPDTKLEKEDVDRFLKLAIELASLKTRLNGPKNDSKQKHDKVFTLNTRNKF